LNQSSGYHTIKIIYGLRIMNIPWKKLRLINRMRKHFGEVLGFYVLSIFFWWVGTGGNPSTGSLAIAAGFTALVFYADYTNLTSVVRDEHTRDDSPSER
jgi:hypothetical protein